MKTQSLCSSTSAAEQGHLKGHSKSASFEEDSVGKAALACYVARTVLAAAHVTQNDLAPVSRQLLRQHAVSCTAKNTDAHTPDKCVLLLLIGPLPPFKSMMLTPVVVAMIIACS